MKLCALISFIIIINAANKTFSLNDNQYQGKTQQQYDNVVFEGGGMKSISYVGSVLALKEMGYFKDNRYTFNKIGGTSTGCLMGLLVSLDILPVDIEKLVYNSKLLQNYIGFNINIFESIPEKPSQYTWFNSIYNTFQLILQTRQVIDSWLNFESPGLSNEEQFLKFISTVLLPLSPHKTEIANISLITFEELAQLTNHNLHCFATQLDDQTIYEFNPTRTPKEFVLRAVYASMSLPVLFKPLNDGNGKTLIDGSLMCNFPITMNDRSDRIDNNTLGFSLHANPYTGQSITKHYSKNTLMLPENTFQFKKLTTIDFLSSLYEVLMSREMIAHANNPINANRIIYLDSPLKAIDWEITNDQKSMAINKAYMKTIRFLQKNT